MGKLYYKFMRWITTHYLSQRYLVALKYKDGTVAAACLILLDDLGMQKTIIKLKKKVDEKA